MAIGDLDGVHGKDIVVALVATGSVGMMLNHGDGTFGALTPYSAGPGCAGIAIDSPRRRDQARRPLRVDGKLDAYVACTPKVVRLRATGRARWQRRRRSTSGWPRTLVPRRRLLALMRRPVGGPAPLLAFQHAPGNSRQLCISYDLDGEALVCNVTPAGGPMVVADINGSLADVPPDEIVTGVGETSWGSSASHRSWCWTVLAEHAHVPAIPVARRASSRPRSATSTTTATTTCSSAST